MKTGPNDEVCVVAVDVGNSAVKLAVQHGSVKSGGSRSNLPDEIGSNAQQESVIVDHSIEIGSTGWELSVIGWVRDQLGCDDTLWRIASVHRSATSQLEHAISRSQLSAKVQLVTHRDVPMLADVDHPDRLGIDRLLGAYAAFNRKKTALVVIDAGSAVTVDWVNQQGHFCGGAILPGLGLQSRSLVMGTEALPQVEWNPEAPMPLPAKNTSDAIRGGIIAGVAGSIDGLIRRYKEGAGLQSNEFAVVVTGGDSPTLSPHLCNNHVVLPNLVCRGLLDLPKSILDQPNTLD